MNGESDPRTHVPSSSGAMFLWQYEFEQSLMNQQLQYQQQAKAMEVSIKEAAQQAASRAAEVGKLLGQENDASTVDVIEELSSSSRRLVYKDIEGVEPQLPPLTPKFFRSKSIPASPISLEGKGNEKGSHRSRSQGTSDMRSSRSEEGRKNEGSASRSRSRSRERRRRHRGRSRSMERRRRYRSRSQSMEKGRQHRRRNRSRDSRRQHSSRSRIREKRRHEKRRRSRSRTRKKLEESCRSSESKRRRESDISRTPPKGHNQEKFSFPGSPHSRSISSHNGGKQRMKSKTVDKTKVVKGMVKLSRTSICSEHFGGG